MIPALGRKGGGVLVTCEELSTASSHIRPRLRESFWTPSLLKTIKTEPVSAVTLLDAPPSRSFMARLFGVREDDAARGWVAVTNALTWEEPRALRAGIIGVGDLGLWPASAIMHEPLHFFPAGVFALVSHDVEVKGISDLQACARTLYVDHYFVGPIKSSPAESAATAKPAMPRRVLQSARERLRDILDRREVQESEPGEESLFEREIAEYVQQYQGAALTEIYRTLFEGDDLPTDLGATLLEALALLPRRVEHGGRTSIFRASLLHNEPVIRLEAARGLLRLRGPLTAEALRAAATRETHPGVRRHLAEILRLLDARDAPAAA